MIRVWASDDDFTSGAETGNPTKEDPGAAVAAQGFIPGEPVAAQHVNHILNEVTASVVSHQVQSMYLHRLLNEAVTIDDTSNYCAAVALNDNRPVLIIKADSTGIFKAGDDSSFSMGGGLVDITGDVVAAKYVTAGRLMAFGDGTTFNEFSTNNGASWTAGGSTGLLAAPVDMCESAISASVAQVLVTAAGGVAYSSNGGVAWANPGVGDSVADVVTGGGVTSVAQVTAGTLVAVGLEAGDPAFARTTDGGVNWLAASGTVPNAASHGDAGWVVGDGGGEVYHAGYRNVSTIDIAGSTDGNTWTTLSTVTSTATISAVRLILCANTGLLVLVADTTDSMLEIRYSKDRGRSWSAPSKAFDFAITGVSVSRGRLFATKGAWIFASGQIMSEDE